MTFRSEHKIVATDVKPTIKQQAIEQNENLPLDCPITNESLVDPVLTHCGHTFEDKSIKDWINRSEEKNDKGECLAKCPCCTKNVTVNELRPNLALKAMLPHLKKQKEQHEKLLAAEKREKEELQARVTAMELALKSQAPSNGKDEKKGDEPIVLKPAKLQALLETSANSEPAVRQLMTALKQLKSEKNKLLAVRVPTFIEDIRTLAMFSRELKTVERNKMKLADDFKKEAAKLTEQFFGKDDKKFDESIKLLREKQASAQSTDTEVTSNLKKLVADVKVNLRLNLIKFYFTEMRPINKKIEKISHELQVLQKAQQAAFSKAGRRMRLRSAALTNGVFAVVSKEVKVPYVAVVPKAPAKVVVASKAALNSAFTNAVSMKNVADAKTALAKGAEVESLHETGYTALQIAVHHADANMVKLLLEHKADPNKIPADENMTLLLRVLNSQNYRAQSPLQQIALLLARYMDKAAVNIKDPRGDSALHWAAYSNDFELLMQLLDKGADANALNAHKRTPLAEMGNNKNEMMAEVLGSAMNIRPGLALR